MDKRRKWEKIINNVLTAAVRLVLFCMLAYAAVRAGALGGSYLYNVETKMIEDIDVGIFKSTLNHSIPLIDTVYNSGNISFSIAKDVGELVSGIFGVDFKDPVTILNSQSVLFNNYYNTGYEKFIAELEENEGPRHFINEYIEPEDPLVAEGEKLPENASSIFFEEDSSKEEVTPNGIVSSGKISVLNQTKAKIDIDKLLSEPLKLSFDKKGPKILVYHTHTTESYLRKLSDLNKKDVANRTQDARYNVVRVGEELSQALRKKYGIEVVHNGTIHDYPNYNYSYGNSLNTITKILKSYPSIEMTLDIHRDAVGGEGNKLRAVTKINNKDVAKIMFVVGTDQGNLEHPNWRENLKLALKLQEQLNAKYPSLAKPILVSTNRYNEHVTLGSLIVEIGGDGNTMEECLESAKYLAEVINDVIK